jgi:hypothetical protein
VRGLVPGLHDGWAPEVDCAQDRLLDNGAGVSCGV